MTCARALPIALFLCLASALLSVAGPSLALTPEEVLVVANADARGSLELAAYYMGQRGIPRENLLELRVTDSENCTRDVYDARIAEPVRRRLRGEAGAHIRALALVYGVPLRVLSPEPTPVERETLARLRWDEAAFVAREGAGGLGQAEREDLTRKLEAVRAELAALRRQDKEASVDSELALVRAPPYELKGWVPNPLVLGWRGPKRLIPGEDVVLVSRLDGPSEAVVRRIVDDSLWAERNGLKGAAYLDARWKDPGPKRDLSGYPFYDRSLHEAAEALRRKGIPVVLEETEALFPAGSKLPAALYCGWYSLSRYVDAFSWQRGAVGYHIASGECVTLKQPASTAWCKRMLEEGVAATLGPVSEPYVQAFPPPNLFMQLLVDGKLTLAEAYALSLPWLSWKMVLVGDPLYRPFGRK